MNSKENCHVLLVARKKKIMICANQKYVAAREFIEF